MEYMMRIHWDARHTSPWMGPFPNVTTARQIERAIRRRFKLVGVRGAVERVPIHRANVWKSWYAR